MNDEDTCQDCGLPHPATNPYCFCKTPTASIAQMNKAVEDFTRDHATALAEAQAEIARLQDQVGDWIVRADEANARADRMEAALRGIAESDDMAAELFTNDTDRADNHADRARAALTGKTDAQGEG